MPLLQNNDLPIDEGHIRDGQLLHQNWRDSFSDPLSWRRTIPMIGSLPRRKWTPKAFIEINRGSVHSSLVCLALCLGEKTMTTQSMKAIRDGQILHQNLKDSSSDNIPCLPEFAENYSDNRKSSSGFAFIEIN
ncbi:hypothetical protein CDAR_116521 [Caerostris darwini]|uniref:Uncharacterized protein n=1 Tax=Caerostris darwini TaxID=1538125 RepID=A0AAV4UHI6_9ARAC|nr:hypothetical protein CDAR_116521 [Caerostris darwini]